MLNLQLWHASAPTNKLLGSSQRLLDLQKFMRRAQRSDRVVDVFAEMHADNRLQQNRAHQRVAEQKKQQNKPKQKNKKGPGAAAAAVATRWQSLTHANAAPAKVTVTTPMKNSNAEVVGDKHWEHLRSATKAKAIVEVGALCPRF